MTLFLPRHLVQSCLGDIVGQYSVGYWVIGSLSDQISIHLNLDMLPRKGPDAIDTGHIDNISLSLFKVGHCQHCQVQHCSDVGCHHPEIVILCHACWLMEPVILLQACCFYSSHLQHTSIVDLWFMLRGLWLWYLLPTHPACQISQQSGPQSWAMFCFLWINHGCMDLMYDWNVVTWIPATVILFCHIALYDQRGRAFTSGNWSSAEKSKRFSLAGSCLQIFQVSPCQTYTCTKSKNWDQ